jgi:hypothetical protein
VLIAAAAGLNTGLTAEPPNAAADVERTVQPFFKEHCCHDSQKQKGDLRVDTLSRDFAAPPVAMHWGIVDRISSAEMSLEDEDQPKADEAARVVEWIAA